MKLPPPKLSIAIRIACALLVLAGAILPALTPSTAHAAIAIGTPRKVTLEPGAADGGSKPSGNVKHLFNFTLTDTGVNLGSVKFQYCTTAAAVPSGIGCNAPAGINTTGVTLTTTGIGLSNFSGTTINQEDQDTLTGSVKNESVAVRTSASTFGSATPVTFELNGIINPSATNKTFFIRISTYTSLDGTGTALEAGTVAASTANVVTVTGIMPESLVFCTGEAITLNTATPARPDCTTATAGAVNFNALFDPTATATATSQFAASTNASNGYIVTVAGTTLTKGTDSIAAMTTATTSTTNTPQFGLNLKQNATPSRGQEITPVSIAATTDQGNASTGYSTADTFKFLPAGDQIAMSDFDVSGTGKPSNSQLYTVTYIANVPGAQPAGTYTATLTYICTATY